MASISRVNGTAQAGAFYGLKGALVTVNYTDKFTADSVDGYLAITEGGYSKAVKALEQVASIIWLGARHSGSDYFSAIIDYATFNDGAGATTTGQYGALADALTSELGGTATTYQSQTTVYTTLAGDGTWAA
jgi:hypothetical protein